MKSTFRDSLAADVALLDGLTDLSLPACGSWPESKHQFDQDSINALKAALAARRPLLLRGEPGTGKSQLARAAAIALKRLFIYDVVTAHTESQDLLWRFDAVGRLAEAQCLQGQGCSVADRKEALDSKKYLCPGPIWWALSWETANEVYEKSLYRLAAPEKPENWRVGQGAVLLIDEIDKANAELPNSLLELLGNNSITLPWQEQPIGDRSGKPPLVIITTNEERELPPAFVRRCLVLHLELPDEEEQFLQVMKVRGELHFPESSKEIRSMAARQLWEDRIRAKDQGLVHLPGQAEYLDLLRALTHLGKSDKEQEAMLFMLSKFTFCKYPAMYER
ncbi:MAG: MoxR family ATPase [Desulfobulbus sp.]|nr:MoxR family ATPase [Desulfobulbus sp.]